jgi:Spy/CpxP family protein refolding chaperone
MTITRTARLWFAAFVVMIFTSGVAVGLLLHRYIELPASAGGWRRGGAPAMRGPSPERVAMRLSDELGLSADQRAALETILEARRGKLEAMEQDVRARFDREHQELDGEIDRILTAEQRERFEEYQQRMRARRPHGPPRRRPPF